MSSILFISNLAKNVGPFSIGSVNVSKSLGLRFYMVANWKFSEKGQLESDEKKYGVTIYDVPINRSPYSIITNYRAYKKICEIVESEKIKYIHCNTPVGGLIGRIVAYKYNLPVIYQAHGFHFYRGASIKNWILYYPVEKFLARYTNAIITINKEDFESAKKFKLKDDGSVYYLPGVGINTRKFLGKRHIIKTKRSELGIDEDSTVIISVGELNSNKNNGVIIKALAGLKRKDIVYLLCGIGEEEDTLKSLAKRSGLEKQVKFLGYRKDIAELFYESDIFVLPSFREGLSRSLMEAMASGLPCIVSDIRGNRDLIKDGLGGYLCDPNNPKEFEEKIKKISNDKQLLSSMGNYNQNVIKKFDISSVESILKLVYSKVFGL
ncbi:MAG: glycosyltransferase family 4 protein [Anaerococcus sp.]|nr:glycosyltransferase family 4 protein [Anaerococcus sp.]